MVDLYCKQQYIRDKDGKRRTPDEIYGHDINLPLHFELVQNVIEASTCPVITLYGNHVRNWFESVYGKADQLVINGVQREIVFLNHPEYLIRWLDQRHAVTNVRSLLRLADLEVEVDEQALRKFLDRSVEVEVVDGVPQEEVKKIWKETKEDSVYLGTTKQIRARRAIRAVRANIDQHAASETHETHPCSFDSCASTFTCKPDRLRHEMLHTNDELPKYPCTHCRRHRGVNGFKRKDHLTQHLRNYHHIQPESSQGWRLVYACSHDDCRDYRPESPKEESLREDFGYPFKTLAARTKHLKEVHNESKFPCPVPLCEKVGGQGYERKSDLVKHINAKHPKAPSSP